MLLITGMTGMNISTCQTADESSDKTTSAGFAGMDIETYDTEAVPQDKKHSAESDNQFLHINLQIYKIHSNDQRSCIIKTKRERITKILSLQ